MLVGRKHGAYHIIGQGNSKLSPPQYHSPRPALRAATTHKEQERKRHTDRGVSSTPSATLSGGGRYLPWLGGGGEISTYLAKMFQKLLDFEVIFTDRVHRLCFQSVHTLGGRGTPIQGRYPPPFQVRMGEYPPSKAGNPLPLSKVGTPLPGQDGGRGTPIQGRYPSPVQGRHPSPSQVRNGGRGTYLGLGYLERYLICGHPPSSVQPRPAHLPLRDGQSWTLAFEFFPNVKSLISEMTDDGN